MHSTMPDTFNGYHFLLLDSAEINAFAAPGGLILVTRGLVQCTTNEDELAAVLAHEIAHVQLRHGVNSLIAANKAHAKGDRTAKVVGAILGQVTVGLGDVLVRVTYEHGISDMVKTMASNGYSREAEFAADQAALVILREAGYSEAGLSSMLQNMSKRLVAGSGFGKTHPPPADRLSALGASDKAPANPVRQARFQTALAGVI
jgi:predicted Zn-dependent protease